VVEGVETSETKYEWTITISPEASGLYMKVK
jgi:hypothetical protein